MPTTTTASTTARTPRKDNRKSLSIRIHPDLRCLIDQAAKVTGKTRTRFLLDAAGEEAMNVIKDQTKIALNADALEAFRAMVDGPDAPNLRLTKSLQTKPIWE